MSAKARILLADESRIVRARLAQLVRDRFEVREAGDGESAWQAILLDASIRLVFAGLTLPKVDSFELIARMRGSKVQRVRELPLVVVCGPDDKPAWERAAALGATDFIHADIGAAELASRLDVLVKLSATREALAESRAALESSRTVDPDTNLLLPAFFDRQVDKLVSYSRRNVTDVAMVCIGLEVSGPPSSRGELDAEQRERLIARALAAALRLEDLATRSDRHDFFVAAQSDGVATALGLAARLRKIVENVDVGSGVEIWSFIGVANLSEDMRLTAEQLRQISQKRAQQAQAARSRRIVLAAADGGGGEQSARSGEGTMDVGLALALIRSGRSAEVVPHLPRLVHQLRPLMALVRQQKELAQSNKETVAHGNLPGVPSTLDQRP